MSDQWHGLHLKFNHGWWLWSLAWCDKAGPCWHWTWQGYCFEANFEEILPDLKNSICLPESQVIPRDVSCYIQIKRFSYLYIKCLIVTQVRLPGCFEVVDFHFGLYFQRHHLATTTLDTQGSYPSAAAPIEIIEFLTPTGTWSLSTGQQQSWDNQLAGSPPCSLLSVWAI